MSFIYHCQGDTQQSESPEPNRPVGGMRPPWVIEVCLKRPALGVVAIPLIKRRTEVSRELETVQQIRNSKGRCHEV